MSDKNSRRTLEYPAAVGNDLFQALIAALDLEGGITIPLVSDVLRVLGSSPDSASIEDVAHALPEIERRLRLILPPGICDPALSRGRIFVLESTL